MFAEKGVRAVKSWDQVRGVIKPQNWLYLINPLRSSKTSFMLACVRLCVLTSMTLIGPGSYTMSKEGLGKFRSRGVCWRFDGLGNM